MYPLELRRKGKRAHPFHHHHHIRLLKKIGGALSRPGLNPKVTQLSLHTNDTHIPLTTN